MNAVTAIKPISATQSQKSIRFPARSFLAFALTPEAPLEDWLESLDRWTENSPAFFTGRPVVLDLNVLKPSADEVAALVAELAERAIRIYAIEANGLEMLPPNLPPLLKGARPTLIDHRQTLKDKVEPAAVEADEAKTAPSLIVNQPVRSGQSIYHPQGDVIVLGSVASGSEIVAGGSVHVYGALRGRVFAGAAGNSAARIFCRKNEAELLSVDGWYLIAEEMEPSARGQAVQVFLDNQAIKLATLN